MACAGRLLLRRAAHWASIGLLAALGEGFERTLGPSPITSRASSFQASSTTTPMAEPEPGRLACLGVGGAVGNVDREGVSHGPEMAAGGHQDADDDAEGAHQPAGWQPALRAS
jgi:hypothetical protein